MFKRSVLRTAASKKIINLTAFSRESRLCSTCAYWAGSRKISPNGYVEIHPYSKGDCQEGKFKHMSMAAMATCDQWKLWFPMVSH